MKFKKFIASIIIACIATSSLAAEALDQHMDINYAIANSQVDDPVTATTHVDVSKIAPVSKNVEVADFYEKHYIPETHLERFYGTLGFNLEHQHIVLALPDFTFPDIVIGRVEFVQQVVYQSSPETLSSLFQDDISNRFYSTAPPVLA